jgi:hypothetical protein
VVRGLPPNSLKAQPLSAKPKVRRFSYESLTAIIASYCIKTLYLVSINADSHSNNQRNHNGGAWVAALSRGEN